MYLLDTNIISELRKVQTGKANKNLVQWSELQEPEHLYLSVITCLEIQQGILKLYNKKDQMQADLLNRWYNEYILPAFSGRILSFDLKTAMICAELHVPDPKSKHDAMIGATAIQHSLILATQNIKDFKNMGVNLINPFEYNQHS